MFECDEGRLAALIKLSFNSDVRVMRFDGVNVLQVRIYC